MLGPFELQWRAKQAELLAFRQCRPSHHQAAAGEPEDTGRNFVSDREYLPPSCRAAQTLIGANGGFGEALLYQDTGGGRVERPDLQIT
jgi:hypothetical protein